MADPVATNPELYSVVFENDRVRVLRYSDHPGDRTQPHEHPDSVMITAASFERRLHHDGKSVDVTIPAGTVRWLDAQEHSGRTSAQPTASRSSSNSKNRDHHETLRQRPWGRAPEAAQ